MKLYNALLFFIGMKTDDSGGGGSAVFPAGIELSTPALPAEDAAAAAAGYTAVDVEEGLLRSSSTFPYYMLVALEAGSFFRGLVLLLIYPIVFAFTTRELGLRIVSFVCLCGLREDRLARVGRTVLPKFLLEDVGAEGFATLSSSGVAKKKVCVTRMPRAMVECFLKEYLKADVVVAGELKALGGFVSGLSDDRLPRDFLQKHHENVFSADESERRKWGPLPRKEYPKPLIFHDGRIAFRPTPARTLAMFAWLPLAFPVAALRLVVALWMPFGVSSVVLPALGMSWRSTGRDFQSSRNSAEEAKKGNFYVCNHRTLADPVMASLALRRRVTAAVYSVSRFTELIAPVRTIRLTRDRAEDKKRLMERLTVGENVFLCPEGTTCREPYLLRFSPLFAELSDEVVPVAADIRVGMFYGTTAGGLKLLDPLFYLSNPTIVYEFQFLETVGTEAVRAGRASGIDVANHVQRIIGGALGFECTALTRKDKYQILAGTDGRVP